MSENKSIPCYAFDGAMMLANKTIRRLWILCIILVVLVVGSNVGWLIYESQYIEKSGKIEQQAEWDSESDVVFNGTGVINYGESQADSDD